MLECELVVLLLQLSVELLIFGFLSILVLLFIGFFDNFVQLLSQNFWGDLTFVLVLIHAVVCLDLSLQYLDLFIEIWTEVLLLISQELLHLSIVVILLLLGNLRLKLLKFLFCLWLSLLLRNLLVLLVDLLLVENLCHLVSFLFFMIGFGQLGTRLLWLWLLMLLMLLRLRIVAVICFDH